MAKVRQQRSAQNRLGFARQLCALRYLGFSPDDVTTAPTNVVSYVAEQLKVSAESLTAYGNRPHTRRDHLQEIMLHIRFHRATPTDLERLGKWLGERALEHDKPTLLFQLACEKLLRERIVRPGVTSLERLVVTARQEAQKEIFQRLVPLLTDEHKALLDHLLVPNDNMGRTRLTWLRQAATSNSPKAILAGLEKLAFLKRCVDGWDLSFLNPNRLMFLAQLGRKSTNQALQRAPNERRYPILVAFVHQSFVDITDEVIDMFDRNLAEAYARASHDLDGFRKSVARATNEKLHLFRVLGRAVLDPEISNDELRRVIYQHIPPKVLQSAVEECDQIIRPIDDSYFDLLGSRYGYIRQFAPAFLEAFQFRSNQKHDPLLAAAELLCRLNIERRRRIPGDACLDFVPPKWRPYVVDGENRINRQYYELCVLWELRSALRAGDIWLQNSRRYANPGTYLIPKNRWPTLRPEVCRQIRAPQDGATRLTKRKAELDELLSRVDLMLSCNDRVRMDDEHIVVSPLEAEQRPESAVRLERIINERLPHVELSDLLIEVDCWTGFSHHFEHAGGSEPRSKELLRHLYASILAQGCNFGLTKMAQIAEVRYDQLAWCNNWYIREETLKAAVGAIVNFQYYQPLSRHWGGGTLSSSDGQRFPVSVKTRNAAALPRYFGYGRGVTFYTWTSDQFSQYGTKIISATVRDATYVLDEILDNETELPISEHITDTSGYTELVFALFDLLDMQFSPRIRDVGDQRLYRFDRKKTYRNLEPRLKGRINRDLILRCWDDLLRVAGSLKLGWVTASLLIGKLQSYPRQNLLTHALKEYGRLIKTIFILRYLENEEYRRQINAQLNKGEALHALRRVLFFANEGKIRHRNNEDQANQALCLNLLTNAVITWNTIYMAAVIDRLRAEGHPVQDDDLGHLSPARHQHINPYGKYRFDVDTELGRTQLRPLRLSNEGVTA
jgi:TnpA family transposase